MVVKIPISVLLLCIFVSYGYGAKILGVFHFPSPSHHILGSHLLKELARIGHEVTMISPYPLKEPIPNYTDIALPEMTVFKEEQQFSKMAQKEQSFFDIFKMLSMTSGITELVFKNEEVQQLINSKNTKFDLVITVWAISDALLGLGHKFQAPVIAFSTVGSGFMNNYLTANSAPYAYVPNVFLNLGDKMTFFERVQNTLGSLTCNILTYYLIPSYHKEILTKYLPASPPIEELRKNISLVLLNSHYSIETPRPSVPNMIQIGGFHVQEPKELSGELKEFLDSATEGVIFFSFGSNLRSADLEESKRQAITKTLASLSLKVLLKWDDDVLPGQPKNVKLGKWLPQRDILAHPNVKAFITHGGLLSTTEAVYHGVPIIGIPFFGDQSSNVKNSAIAGYCIELQLKDLTEETLSHAINEILHNSKYRENIKQRSLLMRDQPLKPLDNAVFWVEHVLKHRGAPHLRVAAMDLSWYQILLLDVVAFLIFVLTTTLFIMFKITKSVILLLLRVCNKSKKKLNVSKQKKVK